MHRGFERIQNDPAAAAAETPAAAATEPRAARRTPSAATVCPFCGTVNDGATPAAPCRQCGMENTQATRTATRGKIGPWFVWQSRNPSAPGMNWATLTALIERGRITPRTIMRGPTTGQLWRFASRVKGVSREFGVCWHCGGAVEKVARLCHACKRLQQPPVNPDALLESDPPAATPAPAPARPAAEVDEPTPLEPQPEVIPPPAAPRFATAPVPPRDWRPAAAAAPAGFTEPAASPENALTGLEMRAFSLPDDYAMPGRTAAPRGRLGRKLLLAAVIAILSGVAAGGYSPQFRENVIRGYRTIVSKISGHSSEAAAVTAPPAQPIAPVPTTVIPRAPERTTTPPASTTQAALPQTPLMAVEASPAAKPPVVASPRQVSSPSIPKSPTATEVTVGPGADGQRARPTPSAEVTATPAPAATQPSPAAGEAHVQVSPPPTDPQVAERWAWERYERAFKAEQKQDYAQAAKDYEWIRDLRLPDGVGPSDVQARLDRVKQLLTQRQTAGR